MQLYEFRLQHQLGGIPDKMSITYPRESSDDVKSASSSKSSVFSINANKNDIRCFNCNKVEDVFTRWRKPKRDRGSCYVCNNREHLRKDCHQTRNQQRTGNPLIVPTVVPRYGIDVHLEFAKVTSIIDIGSPISLLVIHVVPNYVKLEAYVSNVNLEGVNRSKLTILGTLRQRIKINDREIVINFYVVANTTMKVNCLLGRDSVSHDDLNICFDIENVIDDLPDLNLNSEMSQESREQVQDIIKCYYHQPERSDEPLTKLDMDEKASVSEIIDDCSPIVLVKKKSGQLRIA
ncbi:hypothetical protein ILUMI_14585, partial [Ignelater luminosus]